MGGRPLSPVILSVPHTRVGLHPIDQGVIHGVVSLEGQDKNRGEGKRREECNATNSHGGGQEHESSPIVDGWCAEAPAGNEAMAN